MGTDWKIAIKYNNIIDIVKIYSRSIDRVITYLLGDSVAISEKINGVSDGQRFCD